MKEKGIATLLMRWRDQEVNSPPSHFHVRYRDREGTAIPSLPPVTAGARKEWNKHLKQSHVRRVYLPDLAEIRVHWEVTLRIR